MDDKHSDDRSVRAGLHGEARKNGGGDAGQRERDCGAPSAVEAQADLAAARGLGRAVEGRDPSAAHELLKGVPDQVRRAELASDALQGAVAAKDPEMVRVLLGHGACPDGSGDVVAGYSPLFHSSVEGDAGIAYQLLTHGADPHRGDGYEAIELHGPAECGHLLLIALLLGSGAEINRRDPVGDTPLHCAAKCAQTEVARFLADAGADLAARNDKGRTPLAAAVQSGQTGVVRLLAECVRRAVQRPDPRPTPERESAGGQTD